MLGSRVLASVVTAAALALSMLLLLVATPLDFLIFAAAAIAIAGALPMRGCWMEKRRSGAVLLLVELGREATVVAVAVEGKLIRFDPPLHLATGRGELIIDPSRGVAEVVGGSASRIVEEPWGGREAIFVQFIEH